MQADIDNTVIRGKQAEENPAAEKHNRAEQYTGKGGHSQADLDAFMNPVVFSCTEILSCKGGDGNTVSPHNHPENTVHLSVGGPGGNRIRPEGVDAGLDDQIGNGIHGGLQPGRQAYADDVLQDSRGKTDFPYI